jgi:uncharacterized protein (DUF111 family)
MNQQELISLLFEYDDLSAIAKETGMSIDEVRKNCDC